MSALVLIRHGQTDANRDGLLLGRLDPPLNDTGREQAGALAARLAGLRVARVVTSPLRRCSETAEIVAAALGHGGSVEVDERIVEVDYGDFDGTPLASIPADLSRRWRTEADFVPTGGESLAAVGERVGAFAAEVMAGLGDDAVVAVSHVSPIKAAVCWALDLPATYAWRLRLDNASVTRIAPGPDGPVLLTFNER